MTTPLTTVAEEVPEYDLVLVSTGFEILSCIGSLSTIVASADAVARGPVGFWMLKSFE